MVNEKLVSLCFSSSLFLSLFISLSLYLFLSLCVYLAVHTSFLLILDKDFSSAHHVNALQKRTLLQLRSFITLNPTNGVVVVVAATATYRLVTGLRSRLLKVSV
jgi:hypothetical protein